MKGNATLVIVVAEIVGLLKQGGYIDANENFDQTKFDSVSGDLALAGGVESILKAHGVHVPDKVDKILQLLPIVASFIK